jgi:CHAD domain-containing protein
MARRTPALSELPARQAVRHLALRRLRVAARAAKHLNGTDPEALHEFRIAVRRLRTLLRAYRDETSVPRKWRKRLRRIAHATNVARDLEVASDNLRAFAGSDDVAPRELERQLDARRQQVLAETRAQVSKAWPQLARHLKKALQKAPASGRDNFEQLTLRLIDAQWLELQRVLQVLDGAWHEETAHRARLAGKRLRYLCEPLLVEHPKLEPAVGALKAFQDRFGDYRDLRVLLDLLADSTAPHAADTTPQQAVAGAGTSDDPLPCCRAFHERLRARHTEMAAGLRGSYLRTPAQTFAVVKKALEELHHGAEAG